MTDKQKESLIKIIYDLLMEDPYMDMGDMGNCREAAEQTVNNWIATNQIKNIMKTRVYAIDLYELDTEIPVWDLDDDNFIDMAEHQGKVWTLEGFEKAFNEEQISDTWIIRIVTSN